MGSWFMWADSWGWLPVPEEYEATVEWQQRPQLDWEKFAASQRPGGTVVFDFVRKD